MNRTSFHAFLGKATLGALTLIAFGPTLVRADYNPDRIGFCTTYPTSYAGWQSAFLGGDG